MNLIYRQAMEQFLMQANSKNQRNKKQPRANAVGIYNYFLYDENSDISTCQMNNCNSQLKGKRKGNLERHIQTKHPELFQDYSHQKMKILIDIQKPNLMKKIFLIN
jgi:hypothetical protein